MLCSPCGKKGDIDRCANCDTSDDPLLACARCMLVKYCSKTCQSQHWKDTHKKQCIPVDKRRPDTQQKPIEKSKDCEICCICMETVKNKYKSRHLVCYHSFHSECIYRWLEERQCCPLCNKIFSKDDNLSIEYIRVMRQGGIIEINAIIKKLTLCEQSANILNMLSELYKFIGLNDKAEQTLKLSIKKFPSDVLTYFNLAKFYTATNQRHLARKYYESWH